MKMLAFTLVLTRVSAFLLVAPVFSWKIIPVRIKIALTLIMSVFLAMTMPSGVSNEKISAIEITILICNEATYGFAIALVAVLIFSVIKLSGRIIERQMGLAMAQTLDPLTGESGQPLGMLLEMIFILLFLSANGHHMLLMIISKSYESFPSGTIPEISQLLETVVKTGQTMLIICLRLAGPILAAFLALLVILAVLARMLPDMNILFISMPLRVGMGLMMTGMMFPFINQFIGEFAKWMGKLLPL